MTSIPRLTPARIWQLSYDLHERDLAVVTLLVNLRVASVRQLERACFPGQPRTARRVLSELAQRRIVVRLQRTIGGVRAGSAGHVYALDVVGQHLAGLGGPAHGSRLRSPWTPGARFLDHALAVTETYVQLLEQERRGAFELNEFQAEPECWRTFNHLGAPMILKPDAFVRLGFAGYEDSYFIEVDRGTESPRTLTGKAKTFQHYYLNGREQDERGVFPRVLWLVPDAKREVELQAALHIAEVEHLSATAISDRLIEAVLNGQETTSNKKGGDDE